ncbi:Mitotic checkpoint protein BUB3.1 [Capsicum annuum]|nr:Mitotic checkpoint protein BUB3.1 [Capsicum annuum]
MVRLYDVSANAMKEEFMHGGPVLDCCFYDASSGFSASTDNTVRRTLKCWDPRGASGGQEHTLVGTYPQPERVYSLSLVGNRLVVATAWNHVNVYDLRNMSQPEQQRESSLKYRITYVQCYPDGTGLFLILYLLLHSRA